MPSSLALRCFWAVALTSGCAWPTVHVKNIPSDHGGELVISGTGFKPNAEVRLSCKSPGNGRQLLGSELASSQGSFSEHRYPYSFAKPNEGDGCGPVRGGMVAVRRIVVHARELPGNRDTMDTVIVPDCNWSQRSP